MKTFLTLALLVSVFCNHAFAQVTQAEIDKKMKEAQAEIDRLKKDPKTMEKMKNVPNMDSIMKKMQEGNKTSNAGEKPFIVTSDQLPERNNKLLASLPKKILTKSELTGYLNSLDAQLLQKIKPASTDSVNKMVGQLGNDAVRLSSAAMVAWYKNEPEAAVLLAAKAARISTDDNTSLNNCAAILSMAGLENKAIPIFQVLLQRLPRSSTVLNNIGQAYASLGELDTAMYYFGRCIKVAPEHPEANNSAAMICVKKGQDEMAKKYCTQALKGALTSGAIRTYKQLFKEDKIEDLIDIEPWKIYPFNEHDFTFPEQCEKTADAEKVKSELNAYTKRYRDLNDRYQQGYKAELLAKFNGMSAKYASNPTGNLGMVNAETPLSRRAGYAYHKISAQLTQEIFDVIFKHAKETDALKQEYNRKKDELYKSQNQDNAACGQDNLCQVKVVAKYCRLYTELSDQYLPKFAVINRDYVKKRWRLHKELFEAMSVYVRTAVKRGTLQFYTEEMARMGMIFSPLINGEILGDGYTLMYRSALCGDLTDAEIKDLEEMELKDNNHCGIDLEIPMGVAKMTISCDEFEFEGGEFIKGKYNKNFRSGQTTLYAGVGVSEDIPGFEAGATQYVFISFDKNNQPVDAGAQGELELDVKGVTKGDQKVIVKVSMNTGINLEPGPLKALTEVLPYAFK